MAITTVLTHAAISTPTISSVTTATTGGTLPAATVNSYRVSAINETGETLASTAVTVTTGAGSTNSNTVNWGAVSFASGYKVYGRTGGSELLIAEVGEVTSYVDTGSVTPAGALPASNTTNGTGEATSSTIMIAGGASALIGLQTTAKIPVSPHFEVRVATNANQSLYALLNADRPHVLVQAPSASALTLTVKRPALDAGFDTGVYVNQ
jgi:hypothetical protein